MVTYMYVCHYIHWGWFYKHSVGVIFARISCVHLPNVAHLLIICSPKLSGINYVFVIQWLFDSVYNIVANTKLLGGLCLMVCM